MAAVFSKDKFFENWLVYLPYMPLGSKISTTLLYLPPLRRYRHFLVFAENLKIQNGHHFLKDKNLLKNGGHFEFSNFHQKHQLGYIFATVQDRAISSKFSTSRVHLQNTLPKFQKNFGFRKMAAILNFHRKKCKNTKLPLSP